MHDEGTEVNQSQTTEGFVHRDWGLKYVLLGNHGKVLNGGGEGVCDMI